MTTYITELARVIRRLVPPDLVPQEDPDELFALYALLGRVKGTSVSVRDVHDAWVLWMQSRGERHESMVPFDELDLQTQAEDEPFAAAIRSAVAAQQSR